MFLAAPIRDLRPISIIITTLAARAYEQIVRESVMAPRSAVDALIEIVERMPQFVAGPPGARVISNPVIDEENFAEKWRGSDGAVLEAAFYDWHREAHAAVRLGLWKFASQDSMTEALKKSFGPRAANQRPESTTALPLMPIIPKRLARAPKEQFISEMFPVTLTHQLKIDCDVRSFDVLVGKLRGKSRINRWLPYGRQLRFFVSSCDVPLPYDLYWKVRNVGPAALRRGQERGEIVGDAGRLWRDERTSSAASTTSKPTLSRTGPAWRLIGYRFQSSRNRRGTAAKLPVQPIQLPLWPGVAMCRIRSQVREGLKLPAHSVHKGVHTHAHAACTLVFAVLDETAKPLQTKGERGRFDGAGCRDRTRDPLITNQVLYQLS
jgi:hypothetical protein